MRLLPEAVSDTLLDVHETHVYQPLRKALEKVAALSFFPRAVLPNHVTWMSMALLPFVLLTFYGWHFAAAALLHFPRHARPPRRRWPARASHPTFASTVRVLS